MTDKIDYNKMLVEINRESTKNSELEPQYIQYLNIISETNRTQSNRIVELLIDNKKAELDAMLKRNQRICNYLINNVNETRDKVLINIGIYKGMSHIIESFLFHEEKEIFNNKIISQYLTRKYTEEIFSYLYSHPCARHKDLSRRISVSASGLSEIMKNMVSDGLIDKTEQSKYSFYSLSNISYKFMKKKYANKKMNYTIYINNANNTKTKAKAQQVFKNNQYNYVFENNMNLIIYST